MYNNEIPSYSTLLEFQEIYLRAIALAWRESVDDCERMTEHECHNHCKQHVDCFRREFRDDPFMALAKWFNYKCPWNVDLKVSELTDEQKKTCRWDNWAECDVCAKRKNCDESVKCSKRGKSRYSWGIVPKNTVTIGLPNKPSDDKDHAIALAAYSDSGPTYLFTCC